MSVRKRIRQLESLCRVFAPGAAEQKIRLLDELRGQQLRHAGLIASLRQSLAFITAFPDTVRHHRLAQTLSRDLDRQIDGDEELRLQLADTATTGTELSYSYSYHAAAWLCRRYGGDIRIDWDQLVEGHEFDELVGLAVSYPELDYFESGRVSSRDWLNQAKGACEITDICWLMAQLRAARGQEDLHARVYDTAEVPLRWRISARASTMGNRFGGGEIVPRTGMRRPGADPAAEVAEPLKTLRRVDPAVGRRLLDIAMTTLATRHRETYHFVHANPAEVYLADVGQGVSIAVFGLLPRFRFVLDCTMGYLILANGVPIGYGGSSAVFHQINTGVNLLEEYRGSEAAFLWVQVLRTYRQLFGCSHFIANPYQVGHGNKEALKSGAYWFYHRLGFRSRDESARKLAAREHDRMQKKAGYRSDLKTMKDLVQYDVHLQIAGASEDEFFKEAWLEACSGGATEFIAAQTVANRRQALHSAASQVAETLGIQDLNEWAPAERQGFVRMASIVGAIEDLPRWRRSEKSSLAALMKAKGGSFERDYIMRLRKHDRFRKALVALADRIERIA